MKTFNEFITEGAKVGLKRYIKIVKEYQEASEAFKKGKIDIDAMEKAQNRYAAAVNGVQHLDIKDIRDAEDDAGIKEKYKGFL